MKKHILISILFLFAFGSMKSQVYRNIPDSAFRYVLRITYSCPFSGDSLDISSPRVINLDTSLICSRKGITSIEGIQYFTSLRTLSCYTNSISSITTLPASLTYIDCHSNRLTSLPSLPSGLITLGCSTNSLASLPTLPTSLVTLVCDVNYLTSLPTLPSSLTYLNCSSNPLGVLPTLPVGLISLTCYADRLHTLPTLPFRLDFLSCGGGDTLILPTLPPYLTWLDCGFAHLTSLPALPPILRTLHCYANSLTSLPALPYSLSQLWCFSNTLTSLPILPDTLSGLNCGGNLLVSLPSLPRNLSNLTCGSNLLTSLPTLPTIQFYDLDCSANLLTSLPEFPSTLSTLNCAGNIDLGCLPYTPSGVRSVRYSTTAITCLPNIVARATYTPPIGTHHLCYPYLDSCPSFVSISGILYQDNDLDCILDSTEHGIRNVKAIMATGSGSSISVMTSNENGFYSSDTMGFGFYISHIDTTELPFRVNCPTSRYDSILIDAGHLSDDHRNFSLSCLAGYDIGTTGLFRSSAIRPGTPASFQLHAGDMSRLYGVGCAAISGQISINYTGPLFYNSASIGTLSPDSVLPGRLVWLVSDFSMLDFYNSIKPIFYIDSLALSGDLVCFTTDVSPEITDRIPSNNSFTQCATVVASYDPNIKVVSPSGTVTSSQEWMYYTVHFQNTGRSYAENIYLWDTIDSHLDLNSIQVMGSSHDQFMQVYSPRRAVKFSFININLIDSLTDELHSHGYVQYRIKLNRGLPDGTLIQNRASILFDLNPAVRTNTTSTRICNAPNEVDQILFLGIGHSIHVGTHVYSHEGRYIDIFTNRLGCDSIVTTTIDNIPCGASVSDSQFISIRAGLSIIVSGHSYSSSGTYHDTIPNFAGCDSLILVTILNVIPCSAPFVSSPHVIIHLGSSYTVGSHSYTSSGIYHDTIFNFIGCDSIITNTYLDVVDCSIPIIASQSVTIRVGASLLIGLHIYTSTGVYVDTISAYNTCDSILTTTLDVLPCGAVLTDSQDIYILSGNSFSVGLHVYTSSGTYHDSTYNFIGCDSFIMTTTLNVIGCTRLVVTTDTSVIIGHRIIVNGHTYVSSGIYLDTVRSFLGCDSIWYRTRLDAFICMAPARLATHPIIFDGHTIEVAGHTYTATGIYTDTLHNFVGCDSMIITTNLEVITCPSPLLLHQDISIFSGDHISVGIHNYSTSGLYYDTLYSYRGCDSMIITTALTVIICPSIIRQSEHFDIMAGGTIHVGVHNYNTSGIYQDTFQTYTGCDSLVITTTLNVITCDAALLIPYDTSIFLGDMIHVGSHIYSISGIYPDTIFSYFGCDSIIITTTLHVIDCSVPIVTSQNLVINEGQSVNVGTNSYTANGIYHDTLSSSIGCDSVVITTLTVLSGIEMIGQGKIIFYPNPANRQLIIQLEGMSAEPLTVFDIYGRKVYESERITNKYVVNTESLIEGTYIIQCGILHEKVVVKH